MKLYAKAGSPAAQKVVVAAQFAGKKLEIVTNASEKDLAGKAAADRLPLLETSEGCLFESGAIARFVCSGNETLLGKGAFAQAQVSSWCDFTANEIECAAQCVTYPIIGWAENVPEVAKLGKADLLAALKVVDTFLKNETFLVGRAISLADISLAVALVLPFKLALGDKDRKAFPNVMRWFDTVSNQAEFKSVVGPVTLVKKAVAPSAPAKVTKAAAPAKAAEPAPKAAPVDPVKALDALPKSSFVMDAWKRQYSNSPDDDYYQCMPWFWENVDWSGYSVWKSEYNYNDDIPKSPAFMTSNLAGGFIQRCDSVRKHLFGTLNILGSAVDKPTELTGYWLMRGDKDQCMKAILENNADAEYHTWTQITNFDDATKKAIAEAWCDLTTNNGKVIVDGKVFK